MNNQEDTIEIAVKNEVLRGKVCKNSQDLEKDLRNSY